MTDSFVHPECRVDEIFFTNATLETYHRMPFHTKRAGRAAYDGNGNCLSAKNWVPIFLADDEVIRQRVSLAELRREWRV